MGIGMGVGTEVGVVWGGGGCPDVGGGGSVGVIGWGDHI
jgi:hypothetical protein